MKRIVLLVTLPALLIAGLAFGAAESAKAWGYFQPKLPSLLGGGMYVGTPATSLGSTTNKVTKMLGNSATIDFASTSVGVVLSSSITVTGAAAGDPCFVGVPTAAAALKATFGCYVDAADSVKVWFAPLDLTSGTCTLNAASPAVCPGQTVTASSVCTCSNVGTTAAIAAMDCATSVTSTTLTVTAANAANSNVNYNCVAPVDPASGTYYVRVISAQ